MIDDETLIAFIDGELDDAGMDRVAAAIDADPALAERLDALQTTDTAIRETYQPVAEEAVPDHLLDLVRSSEAIDDEPTVLPFRRPAQKAATPLRPGWTNYAAIAASLVLGVLIGGRLGGGEEGLMIFDGDRPIAGGVLAAALEHQASGETGPGGTAIQLSFNSTDGTACRSFLHGETTGLACRENGQWVVQMTAPAETAHGSVMRTASSAMPTSILDAIDARISGDALGADDEAQLIADGWRRSDRD